MRATTQVGVTTAVTGTYNRCSQSVGHSRSSINHAHNRIQFSIQESREYSMFIKKRSLEVSDVFSKLKMPDVKIATKIKMAEEGRVHGQKEKRDLTHDGWRGSSKLRVNGIVAREIRRKDAITNRIINEPTLPAS